MKPAPELRAEAGLPGALGAPGLPGAGSGAGWRGRVSGAEMSPARALFLVVFIGTPKATRKTDGRRT